jgi:hypothetical protein
LSAEKNLFIFTMLSVGNEPFLKSLDISIEYLFMLNLEVICARSLSSPCGVAIISAGLFFEEEKFEKGNGNTTISPFTNFAMLCLPPVCPSLLQGIFLKHRQGTLILLLEVDFLFLSFLIRVGLLVVD